MTNRACLTADAAAFNRDKHVEFVRHFNQLKRLTHDHAGSFTTKVLVDTTAVDIDIARAWTQEYARRRSFATASSVIIFHDTIHLN